MKVPLTESINDLYSINLVNCWKTLQGQSAAKLRQLPQKVQRLSYLGVETSVSKRETPIGDDIVWTI